MAAVAGAYHGDGVWDNYRSGKFVRPKYAGVAYCTNAIIDVGGRGASYLPGSVAGSLSTGAQLI